MSVELLIVISNFALVVVTGALCWFSFREAHRHTESLAKLDHSEVMALIKVIRDVENENSAK